MVHYLTLLLLIKTYFFLLFIIMCIIRIKKIFASQIYKKILRGLRQSENFLLLLCIKKNYIENFVSCFCMNLKCASPARTVSYVS